MQRAHTYKQASKDTHARGNAGQTLSPARTPWGRNQTSPGGLYAAPPLPASLSACDTWASQRGSSEQNRGCTGSAIDHDPTRLTQACGKPLSPSHAAIRTQHNVTRPIYPPVRRLYVVANVSCPTYRKMRRKLRRPGYSRSARHIPGRALTTVS